jgi:HAE1 family hydrophobic/amphiphilic exporter-1
MNRLVALSLVILLGASVPASAFAHTGIIAGLHKAVQQAQEKKANDKKEEEATGIVSVAQTQSQDNQTTQNPITQPIAASPEIGPERVGVDVNKRKALALQDAITLALQNNLDIESSRQAVQISQNSLFGLYGFYDPLTTVESGYQSSTTPNASIFGGADDTGSFTRKSIYYNFTTSQQIQRTGANYLIELNNDRSTTSSTATTLNPQYSNSVNFTFIQPLMRNFSVDQNRRSINLAKKSLDLSDSQFRQQVIDIINSVQRAYWDLVFAIRNELIAREAVRLTRTQLENNQKMVEAGTLAPIELRSTEAQLEQGKGDVIVALQQITIAENTLKGLMLKDTNDEIWSSAIDPTDQPQLGEVSFNLQEANALALKNRPELDQMRLQVEQKEIDISFFKNQIKPQLDFVARYGTEGIAGTGAVRTDPVTGEPVTVPERFSGGLFRSLGNLFGQDFRTYQVGVRLSFPWRNRTAESNLGRSLAEQRQLDARQRQLVQNINIEVRNALQAVEAARRRHEAEQASVLAADAQLKGEQERFRAGLSSNFLVLQRQTDLSIARGREVRALTDYNKALADLQRVTGMTLVSNNVQVPATQTDDKK